MINFGNLKIDYLNLNLQLRNIKQIEKITNFLANLGCKNTLVNQSSEKGMY